MLETNYLSEVGCGKFTADSLSVAKYVGRESKWIRSINKESYIDPDSKSQKLYDDLFTCYNNLVLLNGNIFKSIKVEERKKMGNLFLN